MKRNLTSLYCNKIRKKIKLQKSWFVYKNKNKNNHKINKFIFLGCVVCIKGRLVIFLKEFAKNLISLVELNLSKKIIKLNTISRSQHYNQPLNFSGSYIVYAGG